MWWGAHEGMGWWMLFGMVWMVIFWGAIIWLAVWGVSRFTDGDRRGYGDLALDIARRRYARGEITREEFERLRQDLGA